MSVPTFVRIVLGALAQEDAEIVVLAANGDRADLAYRALCDSASDRTEQLAGYRRLVLGNSTVNVRSAADTLMRHAVAPTLLLVGPGVASGLLLQTMREGAAKRGGLVVDHNGSVL